MFICEDLERFDWFIHRNFLNFELDADYCISVKGYGRKYFDNYDKFQMYVDSLAKHLYLHKFYVSKHNNKPFYYFNAYELF